MLNPNFHSGLVGDLETTSLSRSSSEDRLLLPRKPGGMGLRAHGALRRPKKVIQMEKMKSATGPLAEQNLSILREPALMEGISKKNGTASHIAAFEGNVVKASMQYTKGTTRPPKTVVTGKALDRKDVNSPNKKRYNQNSNDTHSNENDPKSLRPHEENSPAENFYFGKASSEIASGMKEPKRKGSQSSSLLDLAKEDLIKMEQELAFQRDPRALANVENQAPFVCSSSACAPTAVEGIAIGSAPKFVGTILSKDEFTSVIVVIDMPDSTFWVHRESDAANLGALMVELNEKADGYPRVQELAIGETYAVKYEGYWHRATIQSIKPPEIFYVDFGNVEPPQTDDFRSLKDFPIYPAFAVRIRLVGDSKAKRVNADEKLSVKMINIGEDGVVEVVDEDTIQKASAPEAPGIRAAILQAPVPRVETSIAEPPIAEPPKVEPPKIVEVVAPKVPVVQKQPAAVLPSLIDSLNVNDEGYVQVYMALNDKSYAVCVLSSSFQEQFQLIYEKLSLDCAKAVAPQNFHPQVGDFVCGKRDQDWLRGYVFSNNPLMRLALVDEARISPVEQVLPMPDEYTNVCSFGAICTIDMPGATFVADESAQFRVTAVKDVAGDRVVDAVIVESDRLRDVVITLKNWKPTPEQKGIAFAELRPNTEVRSFLLHIIL